MIAFVGGTASTKKLVAPLPTSGSVSFTVTITFCSPMGAVLLLGTVNELVKTLGLDCTSCTAFDRPRALKFAVAFVTVPAAGVAVAVTVTTVPRKPRSGLTVTATGTGTIVRLLLSYN